MITGAHVTIVFFMVATVITDVPFEQFLIRQRTVMYTSLSDIIEACATITTLYDVKCVGSAVSRLYYYLQKKVIELVH